MFPSFRRPVSAVVTLLALAGAAPTAVAAQGPPRDRAAPGAPGARGEEGRQQLERRFRESLGRAVQRELGLTDAQTERLARVNREFEGPRRELLLQERRARETLRTQLRRDDAADARRVDEALETLLRVQRRRLELQELEQRALAQFLTPVQRARYLALQENVRRRVDAERGRQRVPSRPPKRG